MWFRTSVNRLNVKDYKDDYDDYDDDKDKDKDKDPLECKVALFGAALQSGYVVMHRHHMPEKRENYAVDGIKTDFIEPSNSLTCYQIIK